MRSETALLLLDRVEEHLLATNSSRFSLVLHGGEPTLWPLESYVAFFDRIKRLRQAGLDIRVLLQTNAIRLSDDLLDLYAENDIRLGISLDGPQSYNDVYRIDHAGRGSYRSVMKTVDHMQSRDLGHMIGGFLTVANPEIPPAAMVRWADELPVRVLDLLWPMEFNYDRPPWSDGRHGAYRRNPRYGRWFAETFEEWWSRDDPSLVIRLFFETILVLLGSPRHTDMLVNDKLGMFVVNTDGGIEYHDYFRSYQDSGTRTRFRLEDNSIAELVEDALFSFCMQLGDHLPAECADCAVAYPCGGGFLPGRMKQGTALPDRRSVLCYDQFVYHQKVLEHVGPYLDHARADAFGLGVHATRPDRPTAITADLV
jgi:uncharacterized protein